MFGKLTEKQIDRLLQRELVGRIGCYRDGTIYVVPISYVYDGKDIHAHTYEGLKVEIMRGNPSVCFEVDDMKNMSNWQSVIAWGRFEEMTTETDRNHSLQLLLSRKLPVISSTTTHLGATWPYTDDLEDIDGVVFRIRLERRTGRFESNSTKPANECLG